MYLYPRFIRPCRCSFGCWCIYTVLIFASADAFFQTKASTTYSSLNLQMLFTPPIMYSCIYILPFLWGADTSFANFASTSHVFYNMRMLLIEILHPQLAFSTPCRYSCWNFASSISKNPSSQILPINILWVLYASLTEPIYDLQKNWYKKFERIWNGRWWHLERKFLR